MSKKKNVHPDHYKTGGSLRQGEDVDQGEHRERASREKARVEREHATGKKKGADGPGLEPWRDADETEEREEER